MIKKLLWFLPLLLILLTGCGQKMQMIAQEETVQYTNTLVPNEDAERLIEKSFRASEVPWDEERLGRIEKARNAISGKAEYIQDRLNFDSALPYYEYKSWFEFTAYQYMKLQIELDARIAIEGAISEEGAALYKYARRDINSLLDMERTKISATEKSIEDKATAATIEDMKMIYKTIKPLVDMVL